MSETNKLDDLVKITKPEDPAQQHQIEMFMAGVQTAIDDPHTSIVVLRARDKKTGEMQNAVAIMKVTPEGVRVLPLAILPVGKHLVKDYEMMTSDGTPAKPVEQVGSWESDAVGQSLQ